MIDENFEYSVGRHWEAFADTEPATLTEIFRQEAALRAYPYQQYISDSGVGRKSAAMSGMATRGRLIYIGF